MSGTPSKGPWRGAGPRVAGYGSVSSPWLVNSVCLALTLGIIGCGEPDVEPLIHQDLLAEPFEPGPQLAQRVELEPPPFSEGLFPCTDCHEPDMPVKGTRRSLRRAHQEIVLAHDEENLWCLDCHSIVDFDKLHLASGELIDYEDSHRLCGQCHGDNHRDWRAGLHGRRSGNWDGEKTYLLCNHCHSAHAPAFKPITPEPPPKPPEKTP